MEMQPKITIHDAVMAEPEKFNYSSTSSRHNIVYYFCEFIRISTCWKNSTNKERGHEQQSCFGWDAQGAFILSSAPTQRWDIIGPHFAGGKLPPERITRNQRLYPRNPTVGSAR